MMVGSSKKRSRNSENFNTDDHRRSTKNAKVNEINTDSKHATILEEINKACAEIVTSLTAAASGPSHGAMLKAAGLLVGVNSVSRCLEKRPHLISLLVVCQDTNPRLVTKHLIAAAAAHSVPTLRLPRSAQGSSSIELGSTVGVRTATAIGFCSKNVFEGRIQDDGSQKIIENLIKRLKLLL
mmetsp:Transcript_9894/g.13441  ORF Transcript_9894/g.13441 Transcript_9894/m.13441 type:complete len:182 (+) Transcript_9894:85-630(+)